MAKAAKKTPAKIKAAAPKRAPRVKPVPDNYPRVSVYLRCVGADEAMKFYAHVFGAKTRLRLDMPDRRLGHAEMRIGNSLIMISDEFPEMDIVGPITIGGASVSIQIYVKNVDATLALALKAGSRVVRPAADEFYGDRTAVIEDPFGHVWMVQTHIEDVKPAEMKRRLKKLYPPA